MNQRISSRMKLITNNPIAAKIIPPAIVSIFITFLSSILLLLLPFESLNSSPGNGEKKRQRRRVSVFNSFSIVKLLSSMTLTSHRGVKVERRLNASWSIPSITEPKIQPLLVNSGFTERRAMNSLALLAMKFKGQHFPCSIHKKSSRPFDGKSVTKVPGRELKSVRIGLRYNVPFLSSSEYFRNKISLTPRLELCQ